jgi:hypothetical protein
MVLSNGLLIVAHVGSSHNTFAIFALGTRLSCQLHAPAALLRGKLFLPPYQLNRRLFGSQRRYGEERNLATTGNRTVVVQPIAHRLTD